MPPQVSPVYPPASHATNSASQTPPLSYSEEIVVTQSPEASQSPVIVKLPLAVYPSGYLNGQRIGTITLPSLELSWPIYEGTTAAELAKGVGHFSKSVLPGLSDNSVLSGHRSTVFNRLGELEIGDEIFVKTVAGTFIYEVQAFRIVKRTDKTVIVPTSEATLTLTTCYPFNHIGVTSEAFIVTATLKG